MSKLSIGQRAHRVLRFLMGMRTPGVIQALANYGFTEEDLRDGVERLSAVTRTRLKPVSRTEVPGLVEQLDAFENRWFQIARATFEHNYPEIAARFFSNLRQTTGIECVVSVGEFIQRLEDLSSPDGGYGEDGPAARELLATRGLTDELVAEAKALVDELSTYAYNPPPEATQDATAADDALWAWYREWSTIARAAIRDRRMLRALGFRRNRTAVDDADDSESNNPPALPAPSEPAATTPPALPESTPPAADDEQEVRAEAA